MLVIVTFVIAVVLAPIPAAAQNATDRTVNLERVNVLTSPLIPESVRIGSYEKDFPQFEQHVTAPADDDWLTQVQVTFLNMTNRTVTGVLVHVDFPDTEGPQHHRMGYQFRVGETPERATYTREKLPGNVTQHPPLHAQPRGEVSIAFGPEYPAMKKFIDQRQPMTTVHSVWVRILQVYFSDGTRWNGEYQRPDPNDQAGYIAADPKNFRISAPVQ